MTETSQVLQAKLYGWFTQIYVPMGWNFNIFVGTQFLQKAKCLSFHPIIVLWFSVDVQFYGGLYYGGSLSGNNKYTI